MKTTNQKIFFQFTLSLLVFFNSTLFAGGCSSGSGSVIIDNTSTSSVVAVGANLGFTCDGKSSTAIDDGIGGNAINITDFQVLTRDISNSTHELRLFVGKSSETISDYNYGTSNQFDYFADGLHLFDLDRLRQAADWISLNVTPDAGVLSNTYGTISLQQFLKNIADGVTMYGMVRVLVPLEKGQSSSTLNALGTTVTSGSLYGFCNSTSGLCSCAPGKNASFDKIEPNATICGYNMPANAKIKVKGSLFWDFIDSADMHSLALDELPFIPRELYFKVTMPIMVNWAHDINDDGAMDNMTLVSNYSTGLSNNTIITPSFNYSDVPVESKDQYFFETGITLTQAQFDSLDAPDKYHLMLPSGYADGWAEAFDKLNISAADWSGIPSMGTKPFRVPSGVTGVMTANDVRSNSFEDIPTYLYSGGLIDMHDHVNVSGLVYVPQGMELEAKVTNITKQYVSGAIIIRDSFFIEAKSGTVTIISSDPDSYSTIRVRAPTGTSSVTLTFDSSSFQNASINSNPDGSSSPNSPNTPPPSATQNNAPGKVNWQEIRPQL